MYKRRLEKGFAASAVLGRAALLAGLSLLAFNAQATDPTNFSVEGNTINFNFPSWYQVQDSSDYRTLCEGRDPCTVPDGNYIVIDHTIKERYTVTVDGADLGDSTEEITWPDDGWYQVQNAVTYESICEGGTSCTVGPGKYFVINHTTGERTETTVSATITEPEVNPLFPTYSDFKIDGKNIEFTGTGWYQVQREFTYFTVCEGTESCELERSGYHQVRNFTTGQLWLDVFIGEDHSRAACSRLGGDVIGDIGDGAIHRPEYRCASTGNPPAFGIFPLKGEPIAFEGEVCCLR